ncbi:sensor histidine kinase [Olivibacter ginsenosidimutans]|uniref:Sensor histidine kinase n=2 Tax=Olivibacter ginsenosidimutans TaxID=1176537 RepID=A0ABP9C0G6_9SPHI
MVWTAILTLPYAIGSPPDYKIGPLPGLFFTLAGLIHALIFYGNAYLLYPKLFNRRYWGLYLISVLFLLVGSFQLKHALLIQWFPEVNPDFTTNKFIYPPSIGIFVASLIYRKIIDRIHREKIRKEQRAIQLDSELKLLRSQINPHFLFNVLTNLIALARKKSNKLEPSILRLSDLMHYMLYESQQDKVLLTQEVDYLNSYIALQQLRFGDDVRMDIALPQVNETKNLRIDPMLLVPFVENAFKHGTGWINEPTIRIHLTVQDEMLRFNVSNKYDRSLDTNKDKHSGIGLTNVQTRLDLLYKSQYQLKIIEKDNLFTVNLVLKLT